MIDVAIVGGGLCGLALATQLQSRGVDCRLFEARTRLGGRVHSILSARAGMDVDLGPVWIWPQSQPLIVKLLTELGLSTFPQYDEGAVLHLRDPDKQVETSPNAGVRGGARRVEGGVSRLIEALAVRLEPDTVLLRHALTGLRDRGAWVDLDFRTGDGRARFSARRVVLAMPPRLAQEHVSFEPELSPDTVQAMREAPTWMATAAKVVFGFEFPQWRERGWSGDAFVSHEQAVIGEIFDSCDPSGAKAALGGFVALSPLDRDAFRAGLQMLMGNQLGQVFGPEFEDGEQIYHDWAKQRWTCSTLDLVEPADEHVLVSNPLLRRALWRGKLFIGGSETAASEAGYLEGALSAAERIDHAFATDQAMRRDWGMPELEDEGGVSARNMASFAEFAIWVGQHQDSAFDLYRTLLNRLLSAQERDQLTQRAVLEAVEQTFEQALLFLGGLTFEVEGVPVERGRSALMPLVQAPFGDFLRLLMDDVLAFNRTSCALSNFPDEHKLSKLYRETILCDVAAAWKEFCLAANSILLSRAGLGAVGPDVRRAG
jgi:monoamine oxidase